jgi:hypothetical protein
LQTRPILLWLLLCRTCSSWQLREHSSKMLLALLPQALLALQCCCFVLVLNLYRQSVAHGIWGGGVTRGRTPTSWPHTAQLGEADCQGPEAKPHQQDTANTPILVVWHK